MAIIAKASGGNFIPAPAGTHAAVCCDVVDLGNLEVTFAKETKIQHKIKIVWQIAEDRPDGKPFSVSKRYTLSLHEKASLRKDLESWRGRKFTDQELEGWDVESVLGVHCMLNVIEEKKGGDTYSNVAAIMRLPKGMQALSIRDYVRMSDRKTEAQPVGGSEPPESPPAPESEWDRYHASDEDVPF